EKFTVKNEKVSISKRLWQLVKPSRYILIQSLSGAAIFSVLGLATSLYVGKLVDHVIPGGNMNLLNLLGIAMVVIILLVFFGSKSIKQVTEWREKNVKVMHLIIGIIFILLGVSMFFGLF
ncbi:MAG: putative bacteriocin/lantibiotic ABC transporter, ATP-binding protein, partial [Candidatus Moranbacteria bacterium GW2011_GWF2_37_11]